MGGLVRIPAGFQSSLGLKRLSANPLRSHSVFLIMKSFSNSFAFAFESVIKILSVGESRGALYFNSDLNSTLNPGRYDVCGAHSSLPGLHRSPNTSSAFCNSSLLWL